MSVSSMALAQTLLNGALLGCLFGSIALGLSVKWGHLGVADFFHLSLTLLAPTSPTAWCPSSSGTRS